MEKYLCKSSSYPTLLTTGSKRTADSELDWKSPKRVTPSRESKPCQPVKTHNKYSRLDSDQKISSGNSQLREASTIKKNKSKIPPIHLQINPNWTHDHIKTIVSNYASTFCLRYLGKNKIAVHCYTTESHKALQDGLRSQNISFYTFSRKDERAYKYVIFGLPSYAEDQLKEELSALGFPNVSARKLQSSNSDSAHCPPFLVHLQPGADVGAFQKIKYLSSCVVQIRKFKAKNYFGTQCYRCQSFGHSSRHCNLTPRCVKCTESHATENCPKKDRQTPAQCCNCKENHPANYRHCKERQNYLKALAAKKEEQKLVQTAKRLPRSATLDGRSWAAAVATGKGPQNALHHIQTIQGNATGTDDIPNKSIAMIPKHPDNTTAEMLEILTTIKTLKHQFLACTTMIDKVILIMTHLGHCV